MKKHLSLTKYEERYNFFCKHSDLEFRWNTAFDIIFRYLNLARGHPDFQRKTKSFCFFVKLEDAKERKKKIYWEKNLQKCKTKQQKQKSNRKRLTLYLFIYSKHLIYQTAYHITITSLNLQIIVYGTGEGTRNYRDT